MEILTLLNNLIGFSFTSGINVYATVALIGLAIRMNWITNLPPELNVLASDPVISIAIIMYTAEFVADKIPAFDSFWDSVHTFIKPFIAVMLALMVIGDAPPLIKVVAALLACSVSLTTHFTKSSVRLLANTSPEPVSNSILSISEDITVFSLVALILTNPIPALVIISTTLLIIIWNFPNVIWFIYTLVEAVIRKSLSVIIKTEHANLHDQIPVTYQKYVGKCLGKNPNLLLCLKCALKKHFLNMTPAYCFVLDDQLIIIHRSILGHNNKTIPLNYIENITVKTGFLLDTLVFTLHNKKKVSILIYKSPSRSINDLLQFFHARKIDVIYKEKDPFPNVEVK